MMPTQISSEKPECPVCYEIFTSTGSTRPMMSKGCAHRVCITCVKALPNYMCPMPLCKSSFQFVRPDTKLLRLIESQTSKIHGIENAAHPSSSCDPALQSEVRSLVQQRAAKRRATQNAQLFIEANETADSDRGELDRLLTIFKFDDLEVLWIYDRTLFNKVMGIIYQRFSTFKIDAGKVSNRHGLNHLYLKLIALGACEEAANNGDVIAQFCVGYCGLTRGLTEKKQAYKRLKEAADAGLPIAENALGRFYLALNKSLNTRPNYAEALKYLEKSSAKGCTEASYNLGLLHSKPNTEYFNPQKALVHFKEAAEQGFAPALKRVGEAYEQSDDLTMAAYYYQGALERGYTRAQVNFDRVHAQLTAREEHSDLARCTIL